MLTATATATRTVAINAAFLQEIKDDSRHLRDLRIALRALIENQFVLRNHQTRLVTLLEDLRDQLALHFALEEAYGYFEDAKEAAPRLSEIAEWLRGEHSRLFTTLVAIFENAEDAFAKGFPENRVASVVERLRIFDCDLTEHETMEEQLILEAMDRDIGGEG